MLSKSGKFMVAVSWIILISSLIMIGISLFILIASPFYYYKFSIDHGFGSNEESRKILEVAYFVANTIVAIFTPVALILAINQFRQAENSRRAAVYLEINKKYYEPSLVYSRSKIFLLEEMHRLKNPDDDCLSQYAHKILMTYREKRYDEISKSTDGKSEYAKILAFLLFIEDLGVLASKGYMDKKDCFEFIGGIIEKTHNILIDHIDFLQSEEKSHSILANALSLMADAKSYKTNSKKRRAKA